MARNLNIEFMTNIGNLEGEELSKEIANLVDLILEDYKDCDCEECSCEDELDYGMAYETNKDALLFEAITREMLDIYKAKNKDYGNSFQDTFDKIGPKSAATRILDKANRFANLCDKDIEEIEINESLLDTLTDLANYSVMTIMALMQE